MVAESISSESVVGEKRNLRRKWLPIIHYTTKSRHWFGALSFFTSTAQSGHSSRGNTAGMRMLIANARSRASQRIEA